MAGLTIETKLRPCYVITESGTRKKKAVKKKALFHCWNYISNVVDASPLIGGHPGGVIGYMTAIVEFEDGSIAFIHPQNIVFVPGIFEDYSWDVEEK